MLVTSDYVNLQINFINSVTLLQHINLSTQHEARHSEFSSVKKMKNSKSVFSVHICMPVGNSRIVEVTIDNNQTNRCVKHSKLLGGNNLYF